ncbi:hypothetical protein KCP74_19835 [Salmonella enterica subsp. enterica]|nr:hypothetical protein KCP74_19835 [Salmonella enterica subsp. enterica]
MDEGDERSSTRYLLRSSPRVFNFDHAEVAANPVHLFYVLEQQIESASSSCRKALSVI